MTFVAGKRARSVNLDSFTQITSVPVAAITTSGIDFNGDLTAAEVDAVWWFLTSSDDANETERRDIAALRDTLAADSSPANRDALLIALTDYLLDR